MPTKCGARRSQQLTADLFTSQTAPAESLLPALSRLVIAGAVFDPVMFAAARFFLPEGRLGFQIVHQKFAGREGGMAVWGRHRYQHNALARLERTHAVHHGDAGQRPSVSRFAD